MGVQGPFKVEFGELFDMGAFAISTPIAQNEFGAGTRENPVQARDKESNLPSWVFELMTGDSEARERTFKVKVASAVVPVLPDPIPGTPLRPVVLEGLTVTPYIKEGKFPKIAYSLKATGVSAPRRVDAAKQG